jgi:hypothetical protein
MNFFNFLKINKDPDESIIKNTISNLKRNQSNNGSMMGSLMNGHFLGYYYFFYSSFLSIFPQLKEVIEEDVMSSQEIEKLIKKITPLAMERIKSSDPMDTGLNDGGFLLIWTLKSLKDKSLEKHVVELWNILLKHKNESNNFLLKMKSSITDSENKKWIEKAIAINGIPPKRYQNRGDTENLSN